MQQTPTPTDAEQRRAALQKAAQVLRGQAALATAAGYPSRKHVWPYFHSDRQFPLERCMLIERATREKGNTVYCEELAPSADWDVIRKNAGPTED